MKKITFYLTLFFILAVVFIAGVAVSPRILSSTTVLEKIVQVPAEGEKDLVNTKTADINDVKWSLPDSSVVGYPIVDPYKSKFYIYQLDAKKLAETKYASQYQSGSMGRGNTDPHYSPDGKYTVFFQKDKKGLYLISHESLEAVQVPGTSSATYITGWMRDGKRFIYFVEPKTIRSEKEGMMPYEEPATFEKGIGAGFYLFDVTAGMTLSLGPISNIEAIMDDSRVLTKYGEGTDYYDNRMVIFDVDKFAADYSTVKEEFKFGAGQFTFSDDGEEWAFSYSEDIKNVDIIFADFPEKTGTVLEKGSWARVQRPIVSPDGTKVIYQKTIGEYEPGRPREATILFNNSDKMAQLVHEGSPEGWLGNGYVITRELVEPITKEEPNASTYYLINVTTLDAVKML